MSYLKNKVSEGTKKRKKRCGDTLIEKFPLHLAPDQITIARTLQMEAAKVWNLVCFIHRLIYAGYHVWMGETAMKEFVKGRFGIHSQSTQAVVELYFECCERTKKLREKGESEWRYPHRRKYFFTVTWKELGIAIDGAFLSLSNGRGREALKIKLPVRLRGLEIRQVQLVWHRDQCWLHVAVEKPFLKKVEGGKCQAAIDPGEIHAVSITDGQEALVISGRLLRSLHRLRNKKLRWFQTAISRTKRGSRRRRKLLDAKYRFLNNIDRRIEHALHAISAEAVRWCIDRGVTTVYVGDPSGVREKQCGRKHNQRMSQWTFGKLRRLLEYKLKRYGIKLESVDERGTSGTCPVCGEYTKQSGRNYRCSNKDCGFKGAHRDVVGASGILDKSVNGNLTKGRVLPSKVKYSRPLVLAPQKKAS